MDDLWTLILLSLSMLIGCYIAGIIPLSITLSEDKLKSVTVFGAGLLVGTALAVIIPEGINAMYTSGDHSHHHESHSKETEKHTATGHEHHEHHHSTMDVHSLIGITLVSGFIFMLIVDQIGGAHAHAHAPADTEAGQTLQQNRNRITATLGLVVHAAADGIALGAATVLAHTHLTMIVFIAIMLHKMPAAFGLVSFLLHEGFERNRIRKHLLVFALAAPVLAVFTYVILSQRSVESLHDTKTTGIAMLFSAGTFLYVATVHVLPEVSSSKTQHSNPDGSVVIKEHKGFRSKDLVAIVLGAVLPVILSIGHKH
ncbi:zinc transporter ZIP9-B [Magallana gigas]|uniref:Zinc transporter ZIP9-B n=1 Tax=Magallana gigas TaxID=29159 RepID=K1R4Q5_MAGGI|nr:zinc transporter ZIP9-B [Crassostrea gigas]|eukprot:XP_019920918.1 PREDICTED: zinc transporter ZIP9-B isoform X2 [Crassostrea gigas]